MKDKKAVIFYFLMTIILLDFGSQLRKVFEHPLVAQKINNAIFSIVHANNTGSAFSLLQDKASILAIFGITVVLIVALQVIKDVAFSDKTQLLSLTLFSAGALGNSIERLTMGHVVDYVKLNFVNFPIFNAFDIMICTGIFLYCLYIFFDFKKVNNDKN